MAKIFQDLEPMSFEDAIGDVKWDKAMDEEMDALDINEIWDGIWCHFLKASMWLVASGFTR